MHEPEEYLDLITTSSCVITASTYTALEAKVSGAKVILIQTAGGLLYPKDLLEGYGIVIVDGFDVEKVENHLKNDGTKTTKQIEKYDATKFQL
jgi:predicted glycosyltransferase